jgi:hypothetical protein
MKLQLYLEIGGIVNPNGEHDTHTHNTDTD